MQKKIIIETEDIKDEFGREFKEGFKRMHDHRQFNGDRIKRHSIRLGIEKEVKLFVDKAEMVTYVNHLENIQNVEIFKIEDNLYKVLVTRHKKIEDEKTKEE